MIGTPQPLVQRLRDGHKWLGLAAAGLLYVVCLTGVLSIFYSEYERWENPSISEFETLDHAGAGAALDHLRRAANSSGEKPTDLFIGFPTADLPRMVGGFGETAIGYDRSGKPEGSANHDITHFVTELHYTLLLPMNVGLIVVGILGVILAALGIGGALSLPRIARDAFRYRRGQSRLLAATDLHNRIGVWTIPFSLVLTFSGAVMCFGSLALTLAAKSDFKGDEAAAYSAMWERAAPPADAALAPTNGAALERALDSLASNHPGKPPLFMAIRHAGTPKEWLEISTARPSRLIYGETHVFDRQGQPVGLQGYDEGAAGLQIYTSMFRVHAGAFGGFGMKLVYLVLGVGLTLLCTTGITIWFAKRERKGHEDRMLRNAWTGVVWGLPVAIVAFAGLVMAIGHDAAKPLFWGCYVGLIALAALGIWKANGLRLLTSIGLLGLIAAQTVRFSSALNTSAFWMVSVTLVLLAGWLALPLLRPLLKPSETLTAQAAE